MKLRYLLLLSFIAGSLVTWVPSLGQADSFGYSVAKQRLQLKLTNAFVYFSLQGKLDMDSVAIMVSEGEHVPYHLYYDEDFTKGDDNNIKNLLEKGCQYLFKSGADQHDLDLALPYLLSAKSEADKIGNPYWQHASFTTLGKYYLQSKNTSESKRCFTNAVEIARKANDTRLLSRALANRGVYAGYNDEQKEIDLNESLAISRQLHDTIGEIDMLTEIYQIYFVQRKLDTVKSQLLHVTELEKSIGYKHIHYNHRVLSFLEYRLGDWSDVFAECKTAVAIMEANKDFAFSNFIYGAMAQIYSDYGDHEKALYWLEKSISQEPVNKAKRIWFRQFTFTTMDIAKLDRTQQALDFTLKITREYPAITMGDKMNIAHILAYCYNGLNQKELAGKYYAIMVPYLDSLKNDPSERGSIFSAYMDLARRQLSLGNIDATKNYFQKAQQFNDSTDIFSMTRIHWMQYKLDSSAGNYLKALNSYRLTQILDDSIYNLGKAKQLCPPRVA